MAGALGVVQVAEPSAYDATWMRLMGLPMVKAWPRRVRRVVRNTRQVLSTLTFEVGVEPKPALRVVATSPRRALARRRVPPRGIPLPLRPVLVPAPAVLTIGIIGGVPVPRQLLRRLPAAAAAPAPVASPFPLPFLMKADVARPPVRPSFVPFARLPPDRGGQ